MGSINTWVRSRWLSGFLALSVGAGAVPGCGGEAPVADDGSEVGWDEVTQVTHSTVRRQSIGNCWIYATVGWVESLVKRQTRTEPNYSESYLTWWHWYDQILAGEATTEISTGGHWGTAVDIILRHGLVNEGDFIPSEANSEMSEAQRRALATVNTALASGELRDRSMRTAARVRAVLDAAFGTNMATAERRSTRPSAIVVGRSGTRNITLSDAIGTGNRYNWNPDQRTGQYAWKSVPWPTSAASRTTTMRRVLRALNDGQPVIINWLVDFNALDSEGDFELTELNRRMRAGSQGGHLSVLSDYAVDNVPGFGSLGTGNLPAAQRAAAVNGTVRFFTIKNSWGADRADRASRLGYYSLYMDYLNGPIAWKLGEAADAPTSPRNPLSAFVLPPGY
jgi:hypothetical protein